MSDELTVWFNPNCSKCRTVEGILAERGVDANYVRYLEQTPTRAEIQSVLTLLGTDDPRTIMRAGEAVYEELGLADEKLSDDQLFDAILAHPILLQRPIVVSPRGTLMCRPWQRVEEILPAKKG